MRALSIYLKPIGDRIAINYDEVLDFTDADADVWRAQREGDTRRREAIYAETLAANVERATAELALAYGVNPDSVAYRMASKGEDVAEAIGHLSPPAPVEVLGKRYCGIASACYAHDVRPSDAMTRMLRLDEDAETAIATLATKPHPRALRQLRGQRRFPMPRQIFGLVENQKHCSDCSREPRRICATGGTPTDWQIARELRACPAPLWDHVAKFRELEMQNG